MTRSNTAAPATAKYAMTMLARAIKHSYKDEAIAENMLDEIREVLEVYAEELDGKGTRLSGRQANVIADMLANL